MVIEAKAEVTPVVVPFPVVALEVLKVKRRLGRPPKPGGSRARKRSDAADEMSPDEVSRLRREIASEVFCEVFRSIRGAVVDSDLGAGELLRLLADKMGG